MSSTSSGADPRLTRRSETFPKSAPEPLWVRTKAILCTGLIEATTWTMAPAAEDRGYEHQRRHELRQLRREMRRETRDYRCARREYLLEVNRYPRIIPTHGFGRGYVSEQPAGFGVQLHF
ncbi:hypothetical protein MITS9509_02734 [Synechococcus sp. MIT S9509]|nr:hypothetical protein MITS9509_02734 [Synechococcus sp. MIT S9509]